MSATTFEATSVPPVGPGAIPGPGQRLVPLGGLAGTATGAGLAGMIEDLRGAAGPLWERIPVDDLIDLVEAQSRQLAQGNALLLELVNAFRVRATETWRRGSTDPSDLTVAEKSVLAELGLALRLSGRSTTRLVDDAHGIVERLPQVFEALLDGRIDQRRAWVFNNLTLPLDDDLARRIAAEALPRAQRQTPGQLAATLRLLILRADPEGAEGRRRRAQLGRRVVTTQNPDGTANLTGSQLPTDRAALAHEYLNTLASHYKRAHRA